MKKIMIVGAGILQVPMIKKAKEMGLYVGVADYNPEAIGIKYADEYFNCSTIDEEGLLNVCKIFKPSGICTMATDMPMRAIAYVCEKMNLNCISLETAIKATDKYEMIKCFKEYGVSHPKYEIVCSLEELKQKIFSFEMPIILKPTDSSGSRGVVKLDNFNDLENKYNYTASSSKNGILLIEEYMEGPEVSVECFVIDNFVHILQITDKITTGAPHFVELGHTQPSSLSRDKIEKIEELSIKAIQSLGIDTGPVHIEIIYTKSGPKMVELGARMGGDCITSHLVPLSTGIDMIKATILNSIKENIQDIIEKKFSKTSAIRFFNFKEGIIKDIIGLECFNNDDIFECYFPLKIGDTINKITSSVSRTGYFICQKNDLDVLKLTCEKYLNKIKVIYEEE